jgi:UDP-N-acetylmuramoyl-tripeptide--D-alanyl-D-alanine ligase
MRNWDVGRIAAAAGAHLVRGGGGAERVDGGGAGRGPGPERITIDSRDAGPGALFVGLAGAHVDGGEFAAAALAAGAWGALVAPAFAPRLTELDRRVLDGSPAAVLVADSPLSALQSLARAWRRELGAQVIGVTGSTGKTSTKELLAAMLRPHRATVASRANFNTEIGLPLEILAAPAGAEVLVLEMAMRGSGQIAELCEVAEPDVGVIVSIGPVHLELLGSLEVIAAAKAELLLALPPTGAAVVPKGEKLLSPHLRSDLRTLTFGSGGDVELSAVEPGRIVVDLCGTPISFGIDLEHQPHLQTDLLAATAAAAAIGVAPGGELAFTAPAGRGRRITLPGDVLLIDGSYNANPMSMHAALLELEAVAGARGGTARRVAVLGEMLELGPAAEDFHTRLGEQARGRVDLLITVGPLARAIGRAFDREHQHVQDAAAAAELVGGLLRAGDVVLVKGSYGVGLRMVCESLQAAVSA